MNMIDIPSRKVSINCQFNDTNKNLLDENNGNWLFNLSLDKEDISSPAIYL